MQRWMHEDPARAWAQTLPLNVYAGLPKEIADVIEQPIAGTGDIIALSGCGSGKPSHQWHLNGERLHLHPFGRRIGLPTKRDVSAFGIRIDTDVVLDPSPVHRLTSSEFEAAASLFEIGPRGVTTDALDGRETTGNTRALVGNQVLAFEDPRSAANLEATMQGTEALLGPDTLKPIRALLASGGDVDLPNLYSLAENVSSQWTETPKKVLFLRVDFSDVSGNPIGDTDLNALITSSSDQIAAMSYGKTSIVPTVSPTVYRLPQTAASYSASSGGSDAIASATKTAVNSEGTYVLDDYDIHVYLFDEIGFSWAGLASLGGSDHWINGEFGPETMVHEFGHNYGLRHANYWLTSDGTSFGTGSEEEYGDLFDIMGDGSVPSGHFNMHGKHTLNWVEGPDVTTIDEDGTYRVHRIDAVGTTGAKGLRAQGLTNGEDLWIGYRPGQSNPLFTSGAYVTWASGSGTTRLIDTTPDSEADEPQDRQDAPLQMGKTLTVPRASGTPLLITPIGYGGKAPNDYLDVCVRTGAVPGNQPPSAASIDSVASTTARIAPITFTGSATDADGDLLYYAWDFGDGSPAIPGAKVEKAFPAAGTYTVTLTVSDCKGGTTLTTKAITVLESWTERTYSGTEDLTHVAYGNSNYVAIGRGYGAYSSDGTT